MVFIYYFKNRIRCSAVWLFAVCCPELLYADSPRFGSARRFDLVGVPSMQFEFCCFCPSLLSASCPTPHSSHRPRGSPRLSLPLCLSLGPAPCSCLLQCEESVQPAFVSASLPRTVAPCAMGLCGWILRHFPPLRVPFFLRERLRRAGRGGSPWGPAPPVPTCPPRTIVSFAVLGISSALPHTPL